MNRHSLIEVNWILIIFSNIVYASVTECFFETVQLDICVTCFKCIYLFRNVQRTFESNIPRMIQWNVPVTFSV